MNEPAAFEAPEKTMPKDALHVDGAEHRNLHNLYGFYMQVKNTIALVFLFFRILISVYCRYPIECTLRIMRPQQKMTRSLSHFFTRLPLIDGVLRCLEKAWVARGEAIFTVPFLFRWVSALRRRVDWG